MFTKKAMIKLVTCTNWYICNMNFMFAYFKVNTCSALSVCKNEFKANLIFSLLDIFSLIYLVIDNKILFYFLIKKIKLKLKNRPPIQLFIKKFTLK